MASRGSPEASSRASTLPRKLAVASGARLGPDGSPQPAPKMGPISLATSKVLAKLLCEAKDCFHGHSFMNKVTKRVGPNENAGTTFLISAREN